MALENDPFSHDVRASVVDGIAKYGMQFIIYDDPSHRKSHAGSKKTDPSGPENVIQNDPKVIEAYLGA